LGIAHLFHKWSAEELTANYELSLSQVYAALANYYQHKDDLDKYIRNQILNARRAKEKANSGQSSLLSG
jgi:hypothetical protein